MEDKFVKANFEEDMDMPVNGLTKQSPDIRYVIQKKTGKILYYFHEHGRNNMYKHLLNEYSIKALRLNKYGDVLIMK